MTESPGFQGGEGNVLQVPLSALEHYAYCPRQSGLILLEDAFEEDAATVRGTLLHQRVDTPGNRGRGSVRTLHALPVWNDALGLVGVCDTVELHANGRVLPVEHKSGRYRPAGPADVQAAGQAICLEEMFRTTITQAAVYSAADRRRHLIAVDQPLRERVAELTSVIRRMLTSSALPPPVADSRCRRCSMANSCMPRVLAGDRRYRQALRDLYRIAPAPERA
ncbi:CRISPR-associated exonuclease Cas4 [Streptomyces aidingensis]|uniref:CRISPR-associated exonuclease Cas4 n=1 Tax=Streptomyces aidingensis TaxID=910347 RepID=A0A1I1U217_9ACTN|nr:CRISPR-associated exonuclease Cas4 [Streptomyces aidingensis]